MDACAIKRSIDGAVQLMDHANRSFAHNICILLCRFYRTTVRSEPDCPACVLFTLLIITVISEIMPKNKFTEIAANTFIICAYSVSSEKMTATANQYLHTTSNAPIQRQKNTYPLGSQAGMNPIWLGRVSLYTYGPPGFSSVSALTATYPSETIRHSQISVQSMFCMLRITQPSFFKQLLLNL